MLQLATKRLQSELKKDWSSPSGERASFGLVGTKNLFEWLVYIRGPEGCPLYAGQVFHLKFLFSEEYPMEPPEVVFTRQGGASGIPIHPHIYSNGHICLDILYAHGDGGWSPALTASKVALSIVSMLASNSEKRRPEGDDEYCKSIGSMSAKDSYWSFDDDTV
mmetsp:Transcript_9263/g.18397  ORF Transcript_9263/g.18397 Transcript_9263/m.18397 type:complete len:163 (-) Transcript_9263:2142-2630(-)